MSTIRLPLAHPRITVVDDAPRFRHLYCSHYNDCLTDAVRRCWPGFRCSEACDAHQVIDMAQYRADMLGMAEMFCHARRTCPRGEAVLPIATAEEYPACAPDRVRRRRCAN